MPRFTLLLKFSYQRERNCVEKLCVISNALWKRDMVPWPDGDMNFAKNWKSHSEKYVWSEINGQEVDEIHNADVGLEWSNWSAGKG